MTALILTIIGLAVILIALIGMILVDLWELRKMIDIERRNLENVRLDIAEAAEEAANLVHLLRQATKDSGQ